MSDTDDRTRIEDEVREYYRAAAAAGPGARAFDPEEERWGAVRYDDESLSGAPAAAADLSMGCGNPFALADLRPGETVLDLGSGAGLDVILSARRVAPGGRAYGVDFLEEMRELARANARDAGVDNVEFLDGTIDDVPLPDRSVDVVISNCVITLAPDKSLVFAEMARLLRPGGRIAVSDVVVDDDAEPLDPSDSQAWAECGAGGLRPREYVDLLTAAGFVDVRVELTHEVGPGLHAASVTGRRRD